MEIIFTIIGVLIVLFIVRFVLSFFLEFFGFICRIITENFLKIMGILILGYGIQYSVEKLLDISSIFGIYILLYPLIGFIVYYCIKNYKLILYSIKDIIIDSTKSTPSSKDSSPNKKNVPLERFANNGWRYYQYGNRLEGIDEKGYTHHFHLCGDNVWRDNNGYSISEEVLWPKP